MSEISREGFVPRHLRGIDLDQKYHSQAFCQWHAIATTRLRDWQPEYDDHGNLVQKRCNEPIWGQSGLRLCREHTMRIGYLNPRLYTMKSAKRWLEIGAEQDIRRLTKELTRLRRQIAWQAKKLRGEPVDYGPHPAPEPTTDGQIYFLRIGGYIKIGWTSDLNKRMRNGYHPDSQLLAVKPGTRKDERAIHRKHAHLCTHGREWFPMAPQIMEEVQAAIRENGEPPAVLFSAQAKPVPRLGPAPNTRPGA